MTYKRPAIRFVHAMPVAWHPVPGKNLVLSGVDTAELAKICQDREIISHVRYQDHCDRINAELGIKLKASGENAPNPFNTKDGIVIASLSPGTTQVNYMLVWDGTAAMREAGL